MPSKNPTIQKAFKNGTISKGQYDKPDGTKGKSFTSKNDTPCLVYWDLDADGWRMAVGNAKVKYEGGLN